jgi:hypothetical protein
MAQGQLTATHDELLELAEYATRHRDDMLHDLYAEALSKVAKREMDIETAVAWATSQPLWTLLDRLIGPGNARKDLLDYISLVS